MELIFALVVGGLYAAGSFLMLRRDMVKLIIGMALLGHGSNLLILAAGGLTRAHAPVIPSTGHALAGLSAEPVPQALILTAIVIGFGVTAFLLVLVHRAYQQVGSSDIDDLRTTDT